MKSKTFIPVMGLQIFAEGADGGAAQGTGVSAEAAAQQTKGAKSNPLANVIYGIQEESAPAAEVQTTEAQVDLEAEFDKLIKGQYKAQFDARMQDTIRKRLKGPMENAEKYKAVQPVLDVLAKKHGVDAADTEALLKAIEADDSYFEEEALEKGMTVKQLKEFRKMQRENADLRSRMQAQQKQENANKLYGAWMNQAEETKKVYPGFDLGAEMNNPKFLQLLQSNIDVRTAYEVLHKDEIIPAAMQFAAKTVESKVAKKIAAGGARPAENGMSSGSAAVVKSDPSLWTKEDRREVARRVARGEKIRL